jgi:hypothetical protein
VDHRFVRFDQRSDFARESERMLWGGLMTASGADPGYFNEAAAFT